MDSVGVNLIKTAALGRSFELGMLYDCRKDALISGIRPWKIEEPNPNISSRPQINTRFHVTASDSIQDKSELLNIDGGMSLSVLGGLIEVSGAAKYLKDTKKSFIQQRLTLHYHATCAFKELFINHLPSMQNMPDNFNDTATHVVTGVLYGADAYFIFDRKVESDEDKTTVEGELKVAFEKLKGVSVNANVDLKMNDNQKNAVKNFTCTFYGDFQLPSNPTSFEDAMNIFADLPKLLKENQELAVPLRVWLYPLDKLHSRASKLQKDISMDLIMKIESVIESLNTTEMKCRDLMEDLPARTFVAFRDKILEMKKNCYTYKMRLMKKLGSLLPNIRGDMMKETALNDLLQEHDASPFRGWDLADWLKERERESEIIKSVLKRLKDADAQVELNIDAIWMGLEDENLVSYTFTSLDLSDVLLSKQTGYLNPSTQGVSDEKSPDSKQTSWLTAEIKKSMKKNLKMFETLINSKDSCKPAKFIVSSKEMENHPGSCIIFYGSECFEAVCFTPPSKPACPIPEEVRGQSVVLKVPPSCPATVELRLLYKPKQDTVWTSEPVLKDQHTVTLTDLRAETEFEIKWAALGKLNYTRDSDVIRVTTEKSARNRTVTGVTDDNVRIVLLGKTGVGKSATGNTILRREAFKSILTSRSVKEATEFNRRQITVIDTPGLYDTGVDNVETRKEIVKCISMAAPGPHVFLLVIQLGRFTQEEKDTVKMIHETFGEKSRMYTMVLFTRGDKLRGRSIQDFIEDDDSLKNLIQQCGHRYHVFNNNETRDQTQVSELLEKIDCMVTVNGGSFYTNEMFQMVEKNIKERQKIIIREKEEVIKRIQEELRAKYEAEIEEMKNEKEREGQEMQNELRKREEEFKNREEEIKKESDENVQKKMKRKLEKKQREFEEENKSKEKYLGEQQQQIHVKYMEEKQNLWERIQRETREQAEHEYNEKLDRRVAKALKEAEEKYETEKAKALKEAEERHKEEVKEVLQDAEKKHKKEVDEALKVAEERRRFVVDLALQHGIKNKAKALKEAEENFKQEKAKVLKKAEEQIKIERAKALKEVEEKHKKAKAEAEAKVPYRTKRAGDWSHYVPFFGGAAGSLVGTFEDIIY